MPKSKSPQATASKHVVALRPAPQRKAIAEVAMRYEVTLNGTVISDIYYNTRGYVGSLPLPKGSILVMPESPLSRFRTEIRRINLEAKGSKASA